MSRPASIFLLIPALLPLLLCRPGPAAAATLDARLDGSSLAIDTSCARQVEIRSDPTLHDQVVLHATADRQEELDRLRTVSGAVARLRAVPEGCWRPQPDRTFAPTVALVLQVPPGLALEVADSGRVDYAIGPIGGPLALALSGAIRLRDAGVTTLAATLDGDDTVQLGCVDGAAQIVLSGSGSVTVDAARMPALALTVNGVGQVSIAHGQIGSAQLSDNGSGAIRIGATVGTGAAAVAGSGSIGLARVSGPLAREASGIGTITVGNSPPDGGVRAPAAR